MPARVVLLSLLVCSLFLPAKPSDICKACGKFTVCDPQNLQHPCECINGFILGKNGNDCVRRKPLTCDDSTRYLKFNVIQVGKPNLTEPVGAEMKDCQRKCGIDYCSVCVAYSHIGILLGEELEFTCSIWTGNLSAIELDSRVGRIPRTLFVRVHLQNTDPATEPTPANEANSKSSMVILAITLPIGVILLACAIFVYVWRRRRNGTRLNDSSATLELLERHNEEINTYLIDFELIVAATDGFSEANQIGRGRYGTVYKGTFQDGEVMAVKRFTNISSQGFREFMNELIVLGKVQHQHILRLIGYCIQGEEKLFLYEYTANRSLDEFLSDPTQSAHLDWKVRFGIILGIARGLSYLHHESKVKVIHTDLKTSNILLGEDMQPKISNFGVARIVRDHQIQVTPERAAGTIGYMSPEYARDETFSTESDVFSFGVVLLEIISGLKNSRFSRTNQDDNLLGYVRRLWTEDTLLHLVDQSLHGTCNEDEFTRCAQTGLLCVQDEPADRPTMAHVCTMLTTKTASISASKQPHSVMDRGQSSTTAPAPNI